MREGAGHAGRPWVFNVFADEGVPCPQLRLKEIGKFELRAEPSCHAVCLSPPNLVYATVALPYGAQRSRVEPGKKNW